MCGICGIMGSTFSTPEEKFFQTSLLLNVFRGKDSTGVFRVVKDSLESEVAKSMKPSPVAIYDDNDPVKELLNRAGSTALVGHCRAATKGAVNINNAHPFDFDNVVGVHNGTISLKFKGTENFNTDSEALYKLINDHGIDEALNEVESFYNTAYALAWYDKKTKMMNFIRNTERPLHFGYMYGASTLAFSSESWVLRQAASLIKQPLSTHDILANGEKSEVFTLGKHQLFTVNPRNPKEYELRNLKVKAVNSFRTVSTARGGYDYWSDYDRSMGGYRPDETKTQTNVTHLNPNLTKKERKAMRNKSNHSYAEGFAGEQLSYALFTEYLQSGCTLCGKTPMNNHAARTNLTWISSDSYVCETCATEDYKDLVDDWMGAGINSNVGMN